MFISVLPSSTKLHRQYIAGPLITPLWSKLEVSQFVQGRHRPTPKTQTTIAAPVATTAARRDAAGIKVPSIAMLVNVANIPPAGVKAPYIHDWKAAASVPLRPLADFTSQFL
jgi:hypothetical protein